MRILKLKYTKLKIDYASYVINGFPVSKFLSSVKKFKRINKTEPTIWLQKKILENQGEFDILTKDSVWNIEKSVLKRSKK